MKTKLFSLILALALAANAQTAKSQSALLTDFADGQPAGTISPSYIRNFIVSSIPSTKTEGRLLRFGASNAVGQTTGLYEDGSGNVCIFCTSASAPLHVRQAASGDTLPNNAQGIFEFNANGGIAVATPDANGAGIYFPKSTDAYFAGIERDVSNLNFRNGGATKMTIDSSGNVGIGTTSPGAKLEVAGELKLSGGNYGVIMNNGYYGITQSSATLLQIGSAAGWTDGIKFVTPGMTSGAIKIPSAGGLQFVSAAEPTCDASTRGTIVMVQGGAGVADTLRLCMKSAADTYSYVALPN